MRDLSKLFENNRRWADDIKSQNPLFFEQLTSQQAPEYLWIGCADSRVPANQITGLMPGEVFVHRNVANLVVHTDFNCLSVIQFAVEVLQIKHIIVCGHYGCGGVRSALLDRNLGLIDNWLRHIRDVHQKHIKKIAALSSDEERLNRLCELNVIEQVLNTCHTTIVQQAWQRGQPLSIHGWIYAISDGLLKDLKVTISSQSEISAVYHVSSPQV